MPLKCETNLLQDLREFNDFLRLIMGLNAKSYLEIGSKHGGSFWRISHVIPIGSRVVSVDLPHGDASFKNSRPNLEACAAELKRKGYDVHLFIGDSTNETIIAKVRSLGPFDLCFIDANHSEPYVRKDWENYGGIAKVVAFHDIDHPTGVILKNKMPIDVGTLWNELKPQYKHTEIKYTPGRNGIGVLYR